MNAKEITYIVMPLSAVNLIHAIGASSVRALLCGDTALGNIDTDGAVDIPSMMGSRKIKNYTTIKGVVNSGDMVVIYEQGQSYSYDGDGT